MSDHKDPLGVVSHKQDEADPEGVVQVPNYLSSLLVVLHHPTTDYNHATARGLSPRQSSTWQPAVVNLRNGLPHLKVKIQPQKRLVSQATKACAR
jgi:hypothetical protein